MYLIKPIYNYLFSNNDKVVTLENSATENSANILIAFPNELLIEIFKHLTFNQLRTVSSVHKKWNKFCCGPQFNFTHLIKFDEELRESLFYREYSYGNFTLSKCQYQITFLESGLIIKKIQVSNDLIDSQERETLRKIFFFCDFLIKEIWDSYAFRSLDPTNPRIFHYPKKLKYRIINSNIDKNKLIFIKKMIISINIKLKNFNRM